MTQPRAALKVAEVAGDNGLQHRKLAGGVDDMSARFENEKLREEIERLRNSGSLADSSSSAAREVQLLQEENKNLQQQIKILNSSDFDKGKLAAELVHLQAKASGQGSSTRDKNLAELERRLANAEAKKVMAEEQLDGMQRYLTQATVQYQREIVRLRTVIGQLDPSLLKSNPLRGGE